jgi:NarL family two-component system response regulator LiaR
MTIGGQEGFSKASTLARTTLGDVEFERAYNAGRDMSPGMVLLDESSERPSKHGNLTRRERDVLRLLAEGMSNQQIADELFISPRTVTNHLASIFSKLGVHSRTAAVSYALRNQVS